MRNDKKRALAWKIRFLLLLIIFLASLSYIADFLVRYQGFTWLPLVYLTKQPFLEFRGSLLSGAFAAILIASFVLKEERTLMNEMFRTHLRRFATQIPQRMIDSAAKNTSLLRALGRRAKPEDLFVSALDVHLNDRGLAEKAFESLIKPIIRKKGLIYDNRTLVKIADLSETLLETLHIDQQHWPNILEQYLMAHIQFRYSGYVRNDKFRINAASEYQSFSSDFLSEDVDFAWMLSDLDHLAPSQAFRLKLFQIDGQRVQTKIQNEDQTGVVFEAENLKRFESGERKSFLIEIETFISKRDHVIFISAIFPTINWTVVFDCAEAGVRRDCVYAVDSLVSMKKPEYSYAPSEDAPTTITVSIDGWVLTKGGISFVWSLPD